jgi:hypothetical protein
MDLQWLAVRRQDDKLGLTTIECFCGLVGPLPQLPVVRGLLHQVQDLGRQSLDVQKQHFRRNMSWNSK